MIRTCCRILCTNTDSKRLMCFQISAGQAQQLDIMSASERRDFVQDILVNRLNVDIAKLTTS